MTWLIEPLTSAMNCPSAPSGRTVKLYTPNATRLLKVYSVVLTSNDVRFPEMLSLTKTRHRAGCDTGGFMLKL